MTTKNKNNNFKNKTSLIQQTNEEILFGAPIQTTPAEAQEGWITLYQAYNKANFYKELKDLYKNYYINQPQATLNEEDFLKEYINNLDEPLDDFLDSSEATRILTYEETSNFFKSDAGKVNDLYTQNSKLDVEPFKLITYQNYFTAWKDVLDSNKTIQNKDNSTSIKNNEALNKIKYGFKYIVSFDTSFGNNSSYGFANFSTYENSDILTELSKDLPFICIGDGTYPNIFRNLINIYGVSTDYYKINYEKNLSTITNLNDLEEKYGNLYNTDTLNINNCFVVKKGTTAENISVKYGGFDELWKEYDPFDKTSKNIHENIYNFEFSQNNIIQNGDVNPYLQDSSTLYEMFGNNFATQEYKDEDYFSKDNYVQLPKTIKKFLEYMTPEVVSVNEKIVSSFQGFGKVYNQNCYTEIPSQDSDDFKIPDGSFGYAFLKSELNNGNLHLTPCASTDADGNWYYLNKDEMDSLRSLFGKEHVRFYEIKPAEDENISKFDGYVVDKENGLKGKVYAWDSDMPKYKMYYAKIAFPWGSDYYNGLNVYKDNLKNDNLWNFLPNFRNDLFNPNNTPSYIFNHDYDYFPAESGKDHPSEQTIRFLKTNAPSNVYLNQYMNFSKGYFFINGNTAQIEQKNVLTFSNKINNINETEPVYFIIDSNELYGVNVKDTSYINNIILKFSGGEDYYYLQGEFSEPKVINANGKTYYGYKIYYKFEVATKTSNVDTGGINFDDSTGIPAISDIWINGYNFVVYGKDQSCSYLKSFVSPTKIEANKNNYYGYILDLSRLSRDNKPFYEILGAGAPYIYLDDSSINENKCKKLKFNVYDPNGTKAENDVKDALADVLIEMFFYTSPKYFETGDFDGIDSSCSEKEKMKESDLFKDVYETLINNYQPDNFEGKNSNSTLYQVSLTLAKSYSQVKNDEDIVVWTPIIYDYVAAKDPGTENFIYSWSAVTVALTSSNANITYHYLNLGLDSTNGVKIYKNFVNYRIDISKSPENYSFVLQGVSKYTITPEKACGGWCCNYGLTFSTEKEENSHIAIIPSTSVGEKEHINQNYYVSVDTSSFQGQSYTLAIIDQIETGGLSFPNVDKERTSGGGVF